MNTRDLLDALVSGDSLEIENTFNAVMSAKISDALDYFKIDVAQNMFNPQRETEQVFHEEE